MTVTFVPLVAVAFLLFKFASGPWTPTKVVGLILTIFGIGLLTVARIELGSSFSVRPQAKALVTTGIYSIIRHPVYIFSAIGIAGLILYVDRPVLLLLLVPLVVMQIFRARAEERVLQSKFGDEYARYRARTWL